MKTKTLWRKMNGQDDGIHQPYPPKSQLPNASDFAPKEKENKKKNPRKLGKREEKGLRKKK